MKSKPSKYIKVFLDQVSFDFYDLVSDEEEYCPTYYDTKQNIENGTEKILTTSIANLKGWPKLLEDGYEIILKKDAKSLSIHEGMAITSGILRRSHNLESLIISEEFTPYFK